jgi:hypothetical protein
VFARHGDKLPCWSVFAPHFIVVARFLSGKTPTITWGASATIAPYIGAARVFFQKLTQNFSAIYSQLKPVKNLRKSAISGELLGVCG